MQRAFAEAIILGLACGPLGVWILLLRRAYAAESLSHAMLPGLVIAALAGVPLILGAAGGVLVAAGGLPLVARDVRAGGGGGGRERAGGPGGAGRGGGGRGRGRLRPVRARRHPRALPGAAAAARRDAV